MQSVAKEAVEFFANDEGTIIEWGLTERARGSYGISEYEYVKIKKEGMSDDEVKRIVKEKLEEVGGTSGAVQVLNNSDKYTGLGVVGFLEGYAVLRSLDGVSTRLEGIVSFPNTGEEGEVRDGEVKEMRESGI